MALGTADGTLVAFMLGVGEAYIVAFALATGMSEAVAGLIGPLPQLLGAFAGLVIPALLVRLRTVRGLTTILAGVQTAALALLAVLAFVGSVPAPLLFAVAGLYWLGSVGAGAVWNAWVSSIYPRAIRPRYFGRRQRLAQLATLAGLVLAGLLLEHGRGAHEGGGGPVGMYAALFGLAALCRGATLFMLPMLSEPEPVPRGFRDVHAMELIRSIPRDAGGGLLGYMLALNLAVQISGPFFAPYMLGQLRMSYTEYMMIVGSTFLAKSFMLPVVGVLAKRFGAGRMLWIGAVSVIPLSALWVVSDSVAWLIAVNALSGVCWAFYDIPAFLLLFETIPASKRVGMLIRFNLLNFTAAALGALIGGGILDLMGEQQRAYFVLFVVSSALRLAALPIVARVHMPSFRMRVLWTRTLSVGPAGAAVDRPIFHETGDDNGHAHRAAPTDEPAPDGAGSGDTDERGVPTTEPAEANA